MKITDKFVFFYSTADYMSNFHPSVFKIGDITFSCTEQHMMYSKAKLFNDEEIANQILAATEPRKIKALGRKVSNFDENIWKENREKILFEGNLAKYTQNPDLKNQLISTFPKKLVEASPSDRIWGVGLAIDNPKIEDPTNWQGLNLLGEVLTRVRDHILDNKL